jgi:hypothetical protein
MDSDLTMGDQQHFEKAWEKVDNLFFQSRRAKKSKIADEIVAYKRF